MSQKLQITNQVWRLSYCEGRTKNWSQGNRKQEIFRKDQTIIYIFLIESLHQSVKCMIDAVKSLELGWKLVFNY